MFYSATKSGTTVRPARARFVWGMLVICGMVLGCGREPEPVPDARVQRLLQAGAQALDQHYYRAALALADSVEAYDPEASRAAFLRARAYSKLLQFERAQEAYQEVLRRDPTIRGVWNNLGNNALRRGELRQALIYYRKELEQHPAPRPWQGMGQVYRKLGRPDSARRSFERAIMLDSTYVRPHLSLAEVYNSAGAFSKGLAHARRALVLDPENLEARYLIGLLLKRTGQYEKAAPHLRAVTRAQPWRAPAHYNLGQVLARLGQAAAARAQLDSAQAVSALQRKVEELGRTIGRQPDNPGAYVRLAGVYQELGRAGRALQMYKTALYMNPRNIRLRYQVAVLLAEQGAYPSAARWLQAVVLQDSTFVEAWLRLGRIYARMDEQEQAKKAWQTALRLDPENKTARQHLRQLK